jgi:hypothetical protein
VRFLRQLGVTRLQEGEVVSLELASERRELEDDSFYITLTSQNHTYTDGGVLYLTPIE